MNRKSPNTPSGDRRRDRAARRARVAQPLDGNRLRVRSKRLDQVDEDKLSLAFWLLAKQLVEDQSDAAVAEGKSAGASDDEVDGAAGEAEA